MNGKQFHDMLQPVYAKWLDNMTKAECINMAAEIAYIKEIMYRICYGNEEFPDDMDPAWFLDECVCVMGSTDNWYDVFWDPTYFKSFMAGERKEWEKYKKDHTRQTEDKENR